jgi:hypothetical protein
VNLQNHYKLGYKEPTSPDQYADQLLGIEYSFDDVDLSSTAPIKPVKSSNRVKAVWVQNASGGALKPGSLVKCSVLRKTVGAQAGATEIVDGVVDGYLTSDVANGERFFIVVEGPCLVLSNGSYSANAGLASSSSGKAASASTGTVTNFGRAIEAAGAADQLKRAYVDCRAF